MDLWKHKLFRREWQRTFAVVLADLYLRSGPGRFARIRGREFSRENSFSGTLNCVSFDQMETRLPHYGRAEKLLSHTSTRVKAGSEFCEFQKNITKFNKKSRMKCLIQDVTTAILPILPVLHEICRTNANYGN